MNPQNTSTESGMPKSRDMPRRSVLQGALFAGIAIALPFGAPQTAFAADKDSFEVARQRWRESLAGANINHADPFVARQLDAIATSARSAISTYLTSPDRTSLWANLPLQPRVNNTDSGRLVTTFQRLRNVAIAWYAGVLTPEESSRAVWIINDGLQWLNTSIYYAGAKRFGNWFHWDISGPQALNDILVLAYHHTPTELRESFLRASRQISPAIPQTGTSAAAANRSLFCDSFNGRGLLGNNVAEVTDARDNLVPVLQFAQPYGGPVGKIDGDKDQEAFFSHDGFYPDGSFIQHGLFPYVGAYGHSLVAAVTKIGARVAGSEWSNDMSIVNDWIHEAFEPWMWKANVMDTVRGRQLATEQGGKDTAKNFLAAMIDLTASSDGDALVRLKSMIKEELKWRGADPMAGLSLPQTVIVSAIVNDPAIPARGPLTGTRVFGPMDRVLHRREDFAVAFAMNSWRMANYETGDGENKRGWYTSDGATYLYTNDLDQYDNSYWATIDSLRIPGTTVDTVPRAADTVPWRSEYNNPSFWAGGVTAGEWGAATLDLAAQPPSTLKARVSRFFFEDSFICLGTSISVAADRTVETIIENRRVTATSTGPLVVDGNAEVANGQSRTLDNAGWAHIGGAAGYVLLENKTVLAKRETRTGKLSDISVLATGTTGSTIRTGEYLTLAIQHGTDITDDGYAYVVLPGADAATTAAYAETPGVRIVDRSANIHSVRHEATGRFASAFFGPGTSSFVTTDTPVAVALEEGSRALSVFVSDPNQTATSAVIELGVEATGIISADPRIQVAIHPGRTVLVVDFSGLTGSTLAARLAWKAPTPQQLARVAASADLRGRDKGALQSPVGAYLDAVSAGDTATALQSLNNVLAWLDEYIAGNPEAAAVRVVVDLASRLKARIM